MSSSSRPLSCSLVAVPENCASSYFSLSPNSAFSSSPSPSLSSSPSSSHSVNFGTTEYYQQNQLQQHQNFPMMAATLDGNNVMMKMYNSNNSKVDSSFDQQNSWSNGNNSGLYRNGTAKVYQQQPQQSQQQLDQINFLVRKECCNEIDQAVKELGISADPFNWSVSDVQKWLLWMQRWVQLPPLKLELFAMNGMSLCALTEEDFRQRVPNGEKLYAKLDIWRMAYINYFGATEVLFENSIFENGDGAPEDVFGQQQSQQYCASPYSTSSSTDASSLYSGSSPISPEGYGVSACGGSLPPTYAESMYGSSGMCGSVGSSIASPASPASSSHSSVNSCSPYGQQQQNNYGYGPQSMVAPQQQQFGKSMVPMNGDFSGMANTGAMINAMNSAQQRMVATSDYGSDAIPSDDDDMSDDEKCFLEYHQHHRMTLQQQQQQQQQLMQLQQQQIDRALPVQQVKVENRQNDYSPSTSPVYSHGLHHQQHLMQQQQQFGHSRPVHHQQLHPQQYNQHAMVGTNAHSISVVKSELPSSTTTPIAVPAPVQTAPVAPVRTSSSHIHLWQFLKELLSGPHQYGSSIRWLDRSKGVFKIEDSHSVAKLWGARKNRPAMNYDKLSRSIRQYYKKGIMKKTERSQRLVYQFCAPYAL